MPFPRLRPANPSIIIKVKNGLSTKEGVTLIPDSLAAHLLHRTLQVVRFLWVALLIAGSWYLVQFLTPLLFPFLISLVVAIAINRPVTALSRRTKMPRWLSVSLVMLFLLMVLTALFTLFVTETVIEITDLIAVLPQYIRELSDYIQQTISQDVLQNLIYRLEFFYDQLSPEYQAQIDERVRLAVQSLSSAGQDFAGDLLNHIKNFLLSLPDAATIFVISTLGAFFLSKDYELWRARFRRLLPRGVNRRLDEIFADLRGALFGFIKAQLTLISLTAAIVIVGLLILDVEYAITVGLLTGLVDLLPYLGTGTVFVPWIVYSFFKGEYSLVIGLAILYGIVVIFRQIVEPKVVAENVGLDPLLTLVALFAGLQLFGFLGLIIGPVSLVVINALMKAGVFQDIYRYIKGKPITGHRS